MNIEKLINKPMHSMEYYEPCIVRLVSNYKINELSIEVMTILLTTNYAL